MLPGNTTSVAVRARITGPGRCDSLVLLVDDVDDQGRNPRGGERPYNDGPLPNGTIITTSTHRATHTDTHATMSEPPSCPLPATHADPQAHHTTLLLFVEMWANGLFDPSARPAPGQPRLLQALVNPSVATQACETRLCIAL